MLAYNDTNISQFDEPTTMQTEAFSKNYETLAFGTPASNQNQNRGAGGVVKGNATSNTVFENNVTTEADEDRFKNLLKKK